MKTIADVQIGDSVESPKRNDTGIVIGKTPKTITVKFQKSTVKLSYKNKDDYFHESDF